MPSGPGHGTGSVSRVIERLSENGEAPTSTRLTAHEVALSAGLSIDHLNELVDAGFLMPDAEDTYRPSDIARARLVLSLEKAGISLQELADAVGDGRLSLSYVDQLMPEPVALVPVTDVDAEVLQWEPQLRPILGTTRSGDGLVRSDDLRVLGVMAHAIEIGIPPNRVVRIARSFAQIASRLVDLQREFVDEVLLGPAIEETGSPIEALEKTSATRYEYRQLGRALLFELMDRQVDDAVFRNLVQLTELALGESGLSVDHASDGVAFIDISEYSRLSELYGDDLAAVQASLLADLIQDLTREHRARLVKSLGDGALVHAESASGALEVALDAVAQAEGRHLWPLHAGVNVGRVVQRDGDLFGAAVNTAARIAGEARPGEVMVSRAVADAVGWDSGLEFEEAGDALLKNISTPVELFRARRSRID